jgi:hypothetical protein
MAQDETIAFRSGALIAALLNSAVLKGRSARLVEGSFGQGSDELGYTGCFGSFAWE